MPSESNKESGQRRPADLLAALEASEADVLQLQESVAVNVEARIRAEADRDAAQRETARLTAYVARLKPHLQPRTFDEVADDITRTLSGDA